MEKIYETKIVNKTNFKLPVSERIIHFNDIRIYPEENIIVQQASRCLDCGIAYCNDACPLGNVLPDLNALVADNQWHKALDMLHKTNNFPEFTGRLCPALCESACALGLNAGATITQEIELAIIERGYKEGWVVPRLAPIKSGKKVAVVGSGPSGLAVAQQLCRLGHHVCVYERSEEIGGLLTMGIPDYKLEKHIIKRRVNQLEKEGVVFKTGVNVGDDISTEILLSQYHAICLCGGSTVPRDLDVNGRHLKGIHFAMDFLTQQNTINQQKMIATEKIDAKGKDVVIIGGGDTGADCMGIAVRQKANAIIQLELMPKPPSSRTSQMPWPYWPMILRNNSAHEEGGKRQWGVATKYFSGEKGHVTAIHCVNLIWDLDQNGNYQAKEVAGSEFIIKTELVLFAMGFKHPEHEGMLENLNIEKDVYGLVKTDQQYATNHKKVFSAGDMRTGQSLVCKAISDGRAAANAIDEFLKSRD